MRRRLLRHEQKTFPRVTDAGKIYAAATPAGSDFESFAFSQWDLPQHEGRRSAGAAALQLGGKNFEANFSLSASGIELVVDGFYYRFTFSGFKGAAAQGTGQNELRSEIPGRIIKILAQAGQVVEAGEAILIQEAMKMEMTLKSPAKLKVTEILVQEGAQVDADAILVRMAAPEG